MKKVIVIGTSGSLAKYVIDTLQHVPDVHLTLLARNKIGIANDTTNSQEMAKNIVKAMQEAGVKRVIAISSIGIYKTPLKPVLAPYRKLADVIEASGLDYTIVRPVWFTNANEVDYAITKKGQPETGHGISRKSIAALVARLVQNPELYINENLGISKPD